MSRSFVTHVGGAAAIEFAFILPVLVTFILGAFGLGLGLWTRNALQQGVEDTARCMAIKSTDCSTAPTGCDSTSPGICYAETVAARRGVANVKASEVTINASVSYGGANFTSATISHNYQLAGYKFVLTAVALFPNSN